MFEIGRAVTESDFVGHTQLAGGFSLECFRVGHFGFSSIKKVKQSGSGKFGNYKSLIECAGIIEFANHVIGNGFAGLVMLGITLEHFRLEGPVFGDLRAGLDEIAIHIRSGQ